MLQPNDAYNDYLTLHNNFNEAHKIISRQITNLYLLPKKFMEQNEKAIEQCLTGQTQNGIPCHAELSISGIRDFIFEVEDFKLQTMELFFEHRVYIDKCTIYIMRVAELRGQQQDNDSEVLQGEYLALIPQLNELRQGLKDLLEKAEAMVARLEKIETRWNRINSKST